MEYTNNEKFSKPDKNDLYSLALWNENTEKTDAALAIAGKPDEYSASKTYAVGDKCIYENALYKCITAISTAEAWTAGHWAKTSLCAEDTANKAAIKELTENMDHGKIIVHNGEAKITFNNKFKKIPSVVASLIGKSDTITMCIKISNVSLTGANVIITRIKDDGSSGKIDFDHEIYWIALG